MPYVTCQRGQRCGRRKLSRGAFSLVELLVLLGIVVLLISIIVPYVEHVRERAHRRDCEDRLRKIGLALSAYTRGNGGSLPISPYDLRGDPNSYTCFTGPMAPNPFSGDGQVSANDVTACLWLLVRGGYITGDYSPAMEIFICPSSDDTPEPGSLAQLAKRSNFSGPSHLSYSYCSPFSPMSLLYKADSLGPDFAILADKNPGLGGAGETIPPINAPPMQIAKANSLNHKGAGQNVLFADGHVEFFQTPYVGVSHDNIFTALAAQNLPGGAHPEMSIPGVVGKNVGPAWPTDSYLVPTARDK